MAAVMTKEWLVKHCRERGLYQTPYLNDRLYLQCQAFGDIQNLEEYTGVKLLYLEENCLESMNGIQPLKQLQCLYLRRNFIKSIDSLNELQFLETLDISQNYIRCLENLSKCPKLRVLVVSHNHLESIESITHLTSCQSIMILDLSHNKLQDGDGVLDIAMALPQLAVLYLSGNPCISRMPHYRKNIIGKLTKLTHLDDRPVFWDERMYAEAWLRGGQEAETAERDRVREIRVDEETKQFETMRRIREQSMEERLHIVRPNLLQFDPSVLGEDEREICQPRENNPELPQDDINTKEACSESVICNGTMVIKVGRGSFGEMVQDTILCDALDQDRTIPTLAQHSQIPESLNPKSTSTDTSVKFTSERSKEDVEEKLESNPLVNESASVSQRVQKLWPRAKPSMFSSEVQSICIPEWVGSEIRTASYPNIRNNRLFSESTGESGYSESLPDESASKECLPLDHGLNRGKSAFSQRHGRDALASLAVSEVRTDIHQRPISAIKDGDNFIQALQAMNDIKLRLDQEALIP